MVGYKNMEANAINHNQSNHAYIMRVHKILSYSYIIFLSAIVLGIILDMVFPVRIFGSMLYQYTGLFMILFGSSLVYWSQHTSAKTYKYRVMYNEEKYFEQGPYKYSRNPTHIGISIMTIGLGFLVNSLFILVLVVAASLVTKLIFLKKEEDLMEKRYGQTYIDYKKKVRFWV